MRPTIIAIATLTLALLASIPSCAKARAGASSASGEFSFQLESGGYALNTYYHRGSTWAEGVRGQSYAIRVFNQSGARVEAVVTVDGRDVISGRAGDYRNQRGYVIAPYSSVLIEGFRTSYSGVAGFRFTDVDDSYASRMGAAENVGVIGVAVFKEEARRPRPQPYPVPIARDERARTGTGYGAPATEGKSAAKGSSAAAPSSSAGAPCCDDAAESSEQGIGTAYGDEQYSPASTTRFSRRSQRPDERLAIYYDDYQGLVARGVIAPPPPPRPRPEPIQQPHPFPVTRDPQFAPPPPAWYWE